MQPECDNPQTGDHGPLIVTFIGLLQTNNKHRAPKQGGSIMRCRLLALIFQLRPDFLQIITFDDIADFDIIVIFNADAAFVTALNFFGVVFETPQGRNRAFIKNNPISENASGLPALDFAFSHITTCDSADFGDMKHFSNFSPAQNSFFESG